MSDGVAIHRLPELTADDAEAVRMLATTAQVHDRFSALNEAALLRLDRADPRVVHLLATSADGVVGYGQLDDEAGEVTGSLVVSPEHRWAGIGDALLTRMIGEGGESLRIWAPHNTAAAESLAECHRLQVVRRLLIMDRPLDGTWPPSPPPAGIALRFFRPGQDEERWLDVNARAFAQHPEQGRMTREDLDQRTAEPWFDPAALLLAHRADDPGAVVGFHWTKQHPDHLGEVYVLGVDPDAGVRGLGRPLLIAGLDLMRNRGDRRVLLYVESDNTAARRLYDRAGFSAISTDVLYAAAES